MIVNSEFIEANWPLHQVKIGKMLQAKGQRKVGILSSVEGRFVYKIADHSKTREAIERDLAAFDFLADYGYQHIDSILKTAQGNDYIDIQGRYTYLMPYIDGGNPAENPINYAELGRVMGELHRVKGFPFETDVTATRIVDEIRGRLGDFQFVDEYLDLVNGLPDFSQLPKALIHTDITMGNSIMDKTGMIYLVDWDDVGIGTRVLDLGVPMGHFITEELEFHEDNARAFYRGYSNVISLTDAEIEHIFDASLLFALDYLIFGDLEKRWKRILWMVDNREMIENLIGQSIKNARV